VSSTLVQWKSRVIEIDGQLNLPYDIEKFDTYLKFHRQIEYFHLDVDEHKGYLRIRKPAGVLFFEFDRDRFYRYNLFLQGRKLPGLETLKRSYIEEEIEVLREKGVII
jgi:hypothetical protein